MVNNRGKSVTTQPFNKLTTLAVGDEYQDSGKYFLRTHMGKNKIAGPFAPSGKNKTVRHSEFEHMVEYDHSTPKPLKMSNPQAIARRTPECFQKKISYMEDNYERKEDMRKLDYQRRAALILYKDKPFSNRVTQHGTFDPFMKTYGTNIDFPNKKVPTKQNPIYGAFKAGDGPKIGYNSSIGKLYPYMEDPVEDTVTFQKNVKTPVWKTTQVSTTTAWKPQYTTYINTKGQLRD